MSSILKLRDISFSKEFKTLIYYLNVVRQSNLNVRDIGDIRTRLKLIRNVKGAIRNVSVRSSRLLRKRYYVSELRTIDGRLLKFRREKKVVRTLGFVGFKLLKFKGKVRSKVKRLLHLRCLVNSNVKSNVRDKKLKKRFVMLHYLPYMQKRIYKLFRSRQRISRVRFRYKKNVYLGKYFKKLKSSKRLRYDSLYKTMGSSGIVYRSASEISKLPLRFVIKQESSGKKALFLKKKVMLQKVIVKGGKRFRYYIPKDDLVRVKRSGSKFYALRENKSSKEAFLVNKSVKIKSRGSTFFKNILVDTANSNGSLYYSGKCLKARDSWIKVSNGLKLHRRLRLDVYWSGKRKAKKFGIELTRLKRRFLRKRRRLLRRYYSLKYKKKIKRSVMSSFNRDLLSVDILDSNLLRRFVMRFGLKSPSDAFTNKFNYIKVLNLVSKYVRSSDVALRLDLLSSLVCGILNLNNIYLLKILRVLRVRLSNVDSRLFNIYILYKMVLSTTFDYKSKYFYLRGISYRVVDGIYNYLPYNVLLNTGSSYERSLKEVFIHNSGIYENTRLKNAVYPRVRLFYRLLSHVMSVGKGERIVLGLAMGLKGSGIYSDFLWSVDNVLKKVEPGLLRVLHVRRGRSKVLVPVMTSKKYSMSRGIRWLLSTVGSKVRSSSRTYCGDLLSEMQNVLSEKSSVLKRKSDLHIQVLENKSNLRLLQRSIRAAKRNNYGTNSIVYSK